MVYLTRRKKNGKVYLYLEESARINGQPRRVWQKYLGPEERLKDLTLSGLFTKNAESLTFSSLEFGLSAALWQITEKIDLSSLIDANVKKKRHQGLSVGEYITIAAINRCCRPVTKTKLGDWFRKDWISTRYGIKPDILNAQTYWNHFQYLDESILDEIELAINKVVVKEYSLDLDAIFYDPTNFFTYSKGTGKNGLLQFGHSKENRNGNRLVSYTLLCLRDSGIPLMHNTYQGNEQDSKHFKSVPEEIVGRLKKLRKSPADVTLVFDKGNHSKEAFEAIDSHRFGFIASARNSTQKDLLHIPKEKLTSLILPVSGSRVEYHKEIRKIYKTDRTVYVILDPEKQSKHIILFDEKLKEKQEKISEFFSTRLNVKKWRKREAIEEKLQKMIGKKPYKDVLEYSIAGSEGNWVYSIKINGKEYDRHVETLGRSIIFTNRHEWSPEAVIWGYREQYIVEHAFRRMKSPTSIQIRPMYHHTDRSIRCHVYICVLSLLLLSLLRLSLSQGGISKSYSEIQDLLSTVKILQVRTSKKRKPFMKLETLGKIAKPLVKKLKLKSLI